MKIEIQEKPKSAIKEVISLKESSNVYKLKEVQAIKNAIQEHMLFIGLDNCNNVRNINLIGIGTTTEIRLDTKDIIRTALINANNKVILVHNHPSNSTKPSNYDKITTNKIDRLLRIFNITLLDHIIVTENEYLSIKKECEKEFSNIDRDIDYMEKILLLEENERLKNKIEELKKEQKVEDNNETSEDEEEIEM